MDNEIGNKLVVNHSQIANYTNKKEHQQTRYRATEYTRNKNKTPSKQNQRQTLPEHDMVGSCTDLIDSHIRHICNTQIHSTLWNYKVKS